MGGGATVLLAQWHPHPKHMVCATRVALPERFSALPSDLNPQCPLAPTVVSGNQ